ncbi:MAG: hypothetical protein IPQ16_07230 [Geobacteraceae bacterium]|nr:hypothetical protein [Geobacteraceae bacterium]
MNKKSILALLVMTAVTATFNPGEAKAGLPGCRDCRGCRAAGTQRECPRQWLAGTSRGTHHDGLRPSVLYPEGSPGVWNGKASQAL